MEGADLNQRLYERLADVIGTEEDIQSRRDIFKIMDKVNSFGDKDSLSISTGSLPEGFDLEGSDEDITLLQKNIDVIPATIEVSQNDRRISLKVSMEIDRKHQGYAHLYLHEKEEKFVMTKGDSTEHPELLCIKTSLEHVNGKCILSSSKFREQFIRPGLSSHGPCLTDGSRDFAPSLHGSVWPEIAKRRLLASVSKKWITEEFSESLLAGGCNYVPVGPKSEAPQDIDSQSLWRVSFVAAEKRFVESMNHIQFLCYGLLKIIYKERIANQLPDDTISSYILKTCLFWVIQESNNDEQVWNQDHLYPCFLRCISKLIDWVKASNCPNYILPSCNIFFGKVTTSNKSAILKVLQEVKNGGYEVLSSCKTLGPFLMTSTEVSEAEREAKLYLMCSRVLRVYPFDEKDLLFQAIKVLEEENKQETRPFQKGVIGIQISKLYCELAQMIHVNNGVETSEELRFHQCLEYLHIGCQSDTLTGLINVGSFHVREGLHQRAIEILNPVAQKLNPKRVGSVLLRRKGEYSPEEVDHHTKTFCGQGLSLQHKWGEAFVGDTVFLDNSAIVPEEFQLQLNLRPLFMAPPAVYLQALLFLCYHHTGDLQKVQETLKTLEHILKMKYLVRRETHSNACVLVGACYETCLDYENAIRHYREALRVNLTCVQAKYTLERLEKKDLKIT